MRVSERKIRKATFKEEADDLKNTTPVERWTMMWQIALDAWAFKGEAVVESRLQRNIVRLYRRES